MVENRPLAMEIEKIKRILDSRPLILPNKTILHKINACMNTINATEEALECYLAETSDSRVFQREKGLLYVYGATQALFVQQNAMKGLCDSLSLHYPNDPNLKRIRDIRNDIGHPIDRYSSNSEFHDIVNITPNADEFTIVTTYPESKTVNGKMIDTFGYNIINLPNHIDAQKKVFITVLNTIHRHLT